MNLPAIKGEVRRLIREHRYGLYRSYEPPDPRWIYYLQTARAQTCALDVDGIVVARLRDDEMPGVFIGEPVRLT